MQNLNFITYTIINFTNFDKMEKFKETANLYLDSLGHL